MDRIKVTAEVVEIIDDVLLQNNGFHFRAKTQDIGIVQEGDIVEARGFLKFSENEFVIEDTDFLIVIAKESRL